MSYEISVAENDSRIVCIVSAPINREDACKFTSEMIVLAQSRGINRFLMDVRDAPNVLSVVDNYNFAQEDLAQIDVPRGVRVAILRVADDVSHDFIETVTRNAGYSVQIFEDEADAIAWLEN